MTTEASEETIEASPKLVNSQIPQNLTSKLELLPPSKQKDVEQLLLSFHQLFPDVQYTYSVAALFVFTMMYMLEPQHLANNTHTESIPLHHRI